MVVAVTVVHLWRARSDGLAPRNGDDDTDPDGEAMLLAQRTAPTGAFLRVLRRRRERATAVLSTRPEIRPECLMSISLAPRDLGALVAAAGCWGLGTAVSKRAVAEIPPITLLFVQLAVSVAFLSVASLVRGERMPTSGEGVRLSRLGLLNPGMAYALSLLGLAQISASLSVLLWALEPILILALAMLVLRERPGATLLILSATAVGGLFLVVYDPAASGAIIGIVLTVAGVGCCAVYGRHPSMAPERRRDATRAPRPAGPRLRARSRAARRSSCRASDDPARQCLASSRRQRRPVGRPVLRTGVFVLPVGAPPRLRVAGRDVVLSDPCLWSRRGVGVRRPAFTGSMGRSGRRRWLGGVDRLPEYVGDAGSRGAGRDDPALLIVQCHLPQTSSACSPRRRPGDSLATSAMLRSDTRRAATSTSGAARRDAHKTQPK